MDASPDRVHGDRPGDAMRPRSGAARMFFFGRTFQPHDAAVQRGHRWKMAGRLFAWAAVGTVVLVTLSVMVSYWLAGARPRWWASQSTEGHPSVLAADLENALVHQASLVRPTAAGFSPPTAGEWRSDTWTVVATNEQATAWLNERLPAWIANRAESFRWPGELKSLAAAFEDGRVRVGGEVQLAGAARYFSLELAISVGQDGALRLSAEGLRLGRLPIPAAWIAERTRSANGSLFGFEDGLPEVQSRVGAITRGEAVAIPAVFSIGDGRQVRVLSLRPDDGVLTVTCRTELRDR